MPHPWSNSTQHILLPEACCIVHCIPHDIDHSTLQFSFWFDGRVVLDSLLYVQFSCTYCGQLWPIAPPQKTNHNFSKHILHTRCCSVFLNSSLFLVPPQNHSIASAGRYLAGRILKWWNVIQHSQPTFCKLIARCKRNIWIVGMLGYCGFEGY